MNAQNEKIKGIARHFLTLIGGIVISLGLATAGDVDVLTTAVTEIVGAGFAIWGVIASWKNKDKISNGAA